MNLLLDVPLDIFYEYHKRLEMMQLIPCMIVCKKMYTLCDCEKYRYFLKKRQKISCGTHFTMIIKNHQLYTCGLNIMSAPGSFNLIPTPTKITKKNNIVSACCGNDYVVITNMDEVYSIGYNKYVQLTNIKNVIATYSGYDHVFLQLSDGVYVCGKNATGQLGLGYYGDGVELTKNTFFDGFNIVDISLGGYFSYILTDNEVWVCGSNDRGQLGLGNYTNIPTPCKVVIDGMNITASCGEKHGFILTTTGLYGAGDNIYGELGLDTGFSKSFKKIDIDDVIGVKCGSDYSYILTNNNIYVCGNSYYGQLGLNKEQPHYPVIFKYRLNIKNVFCGYDHVLFENTNGKYYGIGSNRYKQLGLGKHKNQKYSLPRQIKF